MDVLSARTAILLALSALLTGCLPDVWSFAECDLDPELCSDDTGWTTVSDCARSDPLQVQIGEGETEFTPLKDGDKPPLHFASSGQGPGVRHVFIGVRIANPDTAHVKFRADFRATAYGPCYGETDGAVNRDGKQVCPQDSKRVAIFGQSVQPGPDGSVAKTGFRLVIEGEPKTLAVTVEDLCGRKGSMAIKTGY